MTQRTVVVLVAAAVVFAAAVAGQADDALRWRIKQLQAEVSRLQAQGAGQAQLAAELDSERGQKDAALRTLASVQDQLRDAEASLVRGQEREAALRQALAEAQGRVTRAESEVADAEAARHALARAEEELSSVRSALAEEQEGHRSTRSLMRGVQQALEQASAAVVKMRFAQGRQNRQNAAAQAELQGAVVAAQQRQWQAEADLVQLRQTRAAGEAEMAAELDSERAQKDAAQQGMASALQELRDAQASLVRGQEREAALQQRLAEARGRLAGAEAQLADQEATRQALATLRDHLDAARSALADEQEGHRTTRSSLADARLAGEQASAAVEQLQFAQARRNEANAAAQAELRQELMDTQQLHWQAEEVVVSLRGELSQAQGNSTRLQQALAEAEAQGDSARLSLASTREDLARSRRTLERAQNNNSAQGQVLANTQAALSETSGSLAQARTAMAEQAEAHAGEKEAAQSAKQEWVERYWDMEQQRASTRAALRKEEMAHQVTQQALDQGTRQARLDGIRMAHLSRDVEEARESLKRALEPTDAARALAELVRQRFADEIQQGQLTVKVGRRGVKLSSAELFDFARAVELGAQSVRTLNRLADILQEVPGQQARFAVHTDNVPLRRGSKWATNWELSTARAAKLARYLIVEKGVAGGRLSIAGYGEYRPVADNSTPEGRRQNRRVEVIIKAPRNK